MFVNIEHERAKAYMLVLKNPMVTLSYHADFDIAYKAIKKERPDLIVFDPSTEERHNLFVTRVKEAFPEIDFMVLTESYTPESIISAFKDGASGYLLYSTHLPEFIQGIYDVLEGGTTMSKVVSMSLVKSFQLSRDTPLTRREQDVLLELSTGKSYRYIAEALNVSIDTVRSHVQNIFEKLEVRNKSEAVIKARQNRLV